MDNDVCGEYIIRSAMKAASTGLGGHRRRSSSQLAVVHAKNVAKIVEVEFCISQPSTLAVAVLHDILEDGTLDESMLRQQFGDEVTDDVVTLTKPRLKKKKARKAALWRSVSLGSERAVIVKLADFIDNIRHRRGTKRASATRKGVLKFLNLLLQRPQTATVWKCVRVLLKELRYQKGVSTALALISPPSGAVSHDLTTGLNAAPLVSASKLHGSVLDTLAADHKMIA